MSEPNGDRQSLEARMAALEATVATLERRISALYSREIADARSRAGQRTDDVAAMAADDDASAARIDRRADGSTLRPSIVPADPGQWVNRLGIALLLLGAAFGFKYSIDRGWIGPAVRVLCGIGLGAALLVASMRVRASRPGLSRVLAGGGIASGYLSIYAAFQLYALMSQGAAVVAMSLVTIAAFFVAVRSDDAMAATIGTIGGLATPVLLSTSSGNVAGLVGYTSAVVAGAGAVFLGRGWRAVLWTSAIGGWLLMAGASELAVRRGGSAPMIAEAGILFLAMATWCLGVVREVLAAEHPARWRAPTFGFGPAAMRANPAASPPPASRATFARALQATPAEDWLLQPHQLALATPVAVLGLSTFTWELERTAAGLVAALLAAVLAIAAAQLRILRLETTVRLAATHAMSAAVMVAFAIALMLDGDAARVGLACEALVMLVLVSRHGGRQPAAIGHLIFLYVSVQTFAGLLEGGDGTAALTTSELSDLAVLAALGGAARVLDVVERGTYLVAAQGGLLLWLHNALAPLDNGATLVTAAWFANAVVLIVAGLRLDSPTLRMAGGVVMAVTMGKLFAVDMARVDAGIRIVTFLGFGAVLLGLGYAFPALWRERRGGGPAGGEAGSPS
jgi:uncharacterized membrane protein